MKRAFPAPVVLAVLCAMLNPASAAPIHDAVKTGDLAKTRQLLDEGADVNAADDQSETPLHRAVELGSLEITQLLLDHNADVASEDNDGNTPVHIAAAKGRRKTIALLVKHGAKIEDHNKEDRTPLDLAIQEGRIATVEDLLNDGAHMGIGEPDGEGGYTWSDDALSVALAAGKQDMVNLLLRKGAVVEPQHLYAAYRAGTASTGAADCTHDQKSIQMIFNPHAGGESIKAAGSAFAKTLMCGDRQLMDSLMHRAGKIEYGAIADALAGLMTPTQLPNIDLFNTLFEADGEIKAHASAMFTNYAYGFVYSGQTSADYSFLAFLLGKGANTDQKDETGNTLLHRVADTGNMTMAKFLLEHGAQVNAVTEWGNTPLFRAIQANNQEMVKYFIEHGADVNAANELGNTPLHFAAARDLTEISALLIKKGAKVNAKNHDGNTPLHQAIRFPGNFDTAKLLLNHGANAKAQNDMGFTALHCAAVRDFPAGENAGSAENANQDSYGISWQHPGVQATKDEDLVNLIKDLLKHKADARARDAEGRTAFDLASENTAHAGIAAYLEVKAKSRAKRK